MKLSLCMIVRNEAEFLARCLNSVADLVDEMIIVDTGSIDQTISIAKGFGAQVVQIEWPNDFAVARNVSLSYATGDWILVLDADEYLDQASQRVLAAFKAQPPPPTRFRLKVVNPDAQGEITRIYYMDRLFPRREGIFYIAPLHEYVIDTHDRPTPSADFFELVIQHVGLLPELMQSRRKLERNRSVLVDALKRFPDDLHCLYHLAGVTIALGDHTQAWPLYQRLLAAFREPPGPDHLFFSLAVIESMACLECLRQVPQALDLGVIYQSSAEHHPDYWLLRGHLSRRLGNYEAARSCFWRCLNIDERTLEQPYRPVSLNLLPLLKLLHLNRALSCHPGLLAERRIQARQEFRDVIRRLLLLWPAGNLQTLSQNLYLLLAEAVLTEANPQHSYLSLLPPNPSDLAKEVMQVLGFFQADFTALLELGQPITHLLELPADGLALAEQLKRQGHDFKAVSLLHLGALYYQRPDWVMVLADWITQTGSKVRARQILIEARLAFPENPLLAELSAQI